MALSPTQTRALTLLGSGVSQEQTAAALGVTPSLVSQWLSETEFASQVTEAKYKKLSAHNTRDEQLDELEDTLIKKLKDTLPLCFKPMEITKMLQVVNAAKRRGTSELSSIQENKPIVSITIPTQVINHFSVNPQGMVTQVGQQSLVTMQSGTLLRKIKGAQNDELSKGALPSPASYPKETLATGQIKSTELVEECIELSSL